MPVVDCYGLSLTALVWITPVWAMVTLWYSSDVAVPDVWTGTDESAFVSVRIHQAKRSRV